MACQLVSSFAPDPLFLSTSSYALRPRLLALAVNSMAVLSLALIVQRVQRGYRLALRGLYKEYSSRLVHLHSDRQAREEMDHFPLVFPIYQRYLWMLLALLTCQLVLSLFTPNSPSLGPAVFFVSITVFTLFHALELGMLVFLCQRSIGSGAIRRSIAFAVIWGAFVLAAVLLAANIDRARVADGLNALSSSRSNSNNNTVSKASSEHVVIAENLSSLSPDIVAQQTDLASFRAQHLQSSSVDASRSNDVVERVKESWRYGSWLDFTGSCIVIDTFTPDMQVTYLACALCDIVLLLFYTYLFVTRIRWLKIMPWLSNRISAFALARFLFLRRALSVTSLGIFLLTQYHDVAFCFNVMVQVLLALYGVCMYIFLVWDSRFWRKLEYLTNGPYPHWRSLDDNGVDSEPPAYFLDQPDRAPARSLTSASIAPLLKLPRTGLSNLDPMISYLVDFSELNIDTSSAIAVGQEDTAVFTALYRGERVAVKRVRCDVLTIDLIDQQLHEAKLMSRLSHPNIVRFIGVCIRPPAICLVSEYCENGSLLDLLKSKKSTKHMFKSNDNSTLAQSSSPLASNEYTSYNAVDAPPFTSFPDLSLSTLLSFASDACSSLAYLHSHTPPIVHHDIKSANFVLDDKFHLKLIDFGESRRILLRNATNQGQRAKGTLAWMPPEELLDLPLPSHVAESLGNARARDLAFLTPLELSRVLSGVAKSEDVNELECFNSLLAEVQDEEDMWADIVHNTVRRIVAMTSSESVSSGDSVRSTASSDSSVRGESVMRNYSAVSPASRTSSVSSSISFNSLSRSLFSSSQSHCEKVDIFALGLLLWSMMTVQPYPFGKVPTFLIPFLVTRGVRPLCPATSPPLLVRLIRACWHPRKECRPSAAHLVERIECLRYHLTGKVSDRLRTMIEASDVTHTRASTPSQSPTPSQAFSATNVHVREGLYGHFYQRPRSRQSSSAGRPLMYTLPPRIPQSDLIVQPHSAPLSSPHASIIGRSLARNELTAGDYAPRHINMLHESDDEMEEESDETDGTSSSDSA